MPTAVRARSALLTQHGFPWPASRQKRQAVRARRHAGALRPRAARRRHWYQSVAGKLLLAFALIVALTVSGAGAVDLTRFTSLEQVLQRRDRRQHARRSRRRSDSSPTRRRSPSAPHNSARPRTASSCSRQNEKLLTQIQDLWTGLAATAPHRRRDAGDRPTAAADRRDRRQGRRAQSRHHRDDPSDGPARAAVIEASRR